MKEKKYIIESLMNYILTCPYLEKLSKFGLNFLDRNSKNYSIEEVPSKSTISKKVDGSYEKQFVFVFASMFDYSEELENQIYNSGFYEDFSDWIEENNDNEIFPKLRDGLIPTSIEVETSGYLYGVTEGMDKARFQIQCKLIYEKEGKIK